MLFGSLCIAQDVEEERLAVITSTEDIAVAPSRVEAPIRNGYLKGWIGHVYNLYTAMNRNVGYVGIDVEDVWGHGLALGRRVRGPEPSVSFDPEGVGRTTG